MLLSQDTIDDIQAIIQAQGMVSNGILSIGIDRDDFPNIKKGNVPIKPSFQVNGNLFFQGIVGGRAAMNGDMALKPGEIDPFIDQLLTHNIVFQAEHQHFYDLSPMVWFIHFRMFGDPIEIAEGVKAALNATSTPFPQRSPNNPTTPLPAEELGRILGATPSIGANGVVTFDVPRKELIRLAGIRISPYLNIASSIVFEPHGGGEHAAVAPDFALIASEVNEVVRLMRARDWDIGCLYNQETDEHPQLYFSHEFKTGDSIELAEEIRAALNLTILNFCPRCGWRFTCAGINSFDPVSSYRGRDACCDGAGVGAVCGCGCCCGGCGIGGGGRLHPLASAMIATQHAVKNETRIVLPISEILGGWRCTRM
jgi:hypothetical protein